MALLTGLKHRIQGFGPIKLASKSYFLMAIAILLPLTTWGTIHNFRTTMMLLTTFGLAYMSKGIRNRATKS